MSAVLSRIGLNRGWRPATTLHGDMGDGTGARALVVDDAAEFRELVASVLRSEGFVVELAADGPAALAAARSFAPEVVLLDLGLPGMDGFELCRRLKRDSALSGARVIAITGYGHDDYRRRALEAGCELHLLKPVPTEVLEALLR
jgi:CheY-like chemotaxis protein